MRRCNLEHYILYLFKLLFGEGGILPVRQNYSVNRIQLVLLCLYVICRIGCERLVYAKLRQRVIKRLYRLVNVIIGATGRGYGFYQLQCSYLRRLLTCFSL